MLNLIRKDLLIVKKVAPVTMGLVLLMIVFLYSFASFLPAPALLVYAVICNVLALVPSIAAEEEKYPKAAALLCAVGYSRTQHVVAKYLILPLLFVYCLLISIVIMMVKDSTIIIEANTILLSFLVGALVFCVYMPILLKFGSSRGRYIVFVPIVLLIAMGPVVVSRVFPAFHLGQIITSILSHYLALPVLIVGIVVIFFLSMLVSLKIYSKKEL